jgi:hypothetical protein
MDPDEQRRRVHERAVDQAYQNLGLQRIDVDINSLSDFADVLMREYHEHLLPAWDNINKKLIAGGPQFGNSPDLELGKKRTDYATYLRETQEFLRSVIMGVYQFAQSAKEIGGRYQRADQFARVTIGDVTSVLPNIPAPDNSTPGTTPTY